MRAEDVFLLQTIGGGADSPREIYTVKLGGDTTDAASAHRVDTCGGV